MMTEMIERLSRKIFIWFFFLPISKHYRIDFLADDDLSSFYTSLSTVLSTSSAEPQAQTNLIEHQIAHNVLRHLIIADGKRQKKIKQDQCKIFLEKIFCIDGILFDLALISTILSSISSDILRAWILCNRGCFIFVV